MPYKDKETRRAYDREYKRKRRRRLRASNPSPPWSGLDTPGRVRPATIWLKEHGLLEEK